MRLQSPFDHAVSLPTLGVTVEPGGAVSVDADAAESLTAAGWLPVKTTKATKAAESQED